MGGKNDENVEQADLPQGFGSSFSDKNIRMKFIRKVYAILLSQLLVTTGIIALFIFTPALRTLYLIESKCGSMAGEGAPRCVLNGNGLILYIVSYVVFIVTYFAIACCERVRKRSPGNMIAMGVFTLALSFMCASICLFHDVEWVMMAMGITAGLCLGLTLFSFQTKIDFTGIGVYLFAACWVLFLFGILACVFAARGDRVIYTVYAGLMALLFSMFLIFDTQRIMGGKKYSISPEEHIFASIQIYVDVVFIFLAILGLGGRD